MRLRGIRLEGVNKLILAAAESGRCAGAAGVPDAAAGADGEVDV